MDLILVRHCETSMNEARRYMGWANAPLSAGGRKRAEAMSRWVPQRLPVGVNVWVSDLRRARETASSVLPGESARVDPRLREMNFGAFEGRTYEENRQQFGSTFEHWLADPERYSPPQGESLSTMRSRVLAWVKEIAQCGSPTVAVTHGGPLRILLGWGLCESMSRVLRVELPPGVVLRGQLLSGRLENVERLNDSTIPPP